MRCRRHTNEVERIIDRRRQRHVIKEPTRRRHDESSRHGESCRRDASNSSANCRRGEASETPRREVATPRRVAGIICAAARPPPPPARLVARHLVAHHLVAYRLVVFRLRLRIISIIVLHRLVAIVADFALLLVCCFFFFRLDMLFKPPPLPTLAPQAVTGGITKRALAGESGSTSAAQRARSPTNRALSPIRSLIRALSPVINSISRLCETFLISICIDVM